LKRANLRRNWSLTVSKADSKGRTIWIADAHRGNGKRFVVHAEEKLTAFLELESAIAFAANWFDRLARFLPNSASLKPILNQAEDSPR